jgi:hypothetical protein
MQRDDPHGRWVGCFEVGHHQDNFKAFKTTSHKDILFALFQYNFLKLDLKYKIIFIIVLCRMRTIVINKRMFYTSTVVYIVTYFGVCVTYRRVLDSMIGFNDTLKTPLGTTGNYSAIADLHTSQFTVTHTLGFSVFISRILATDFNTAVTLVSL